MKIIVGDIYSTVDNPSQHLDELEHIREICRARPENYMYMPKYRAGLWDGFISLMKGMISFPTGLLDRIVGELHAAGYPIELQYTTKYPKAARVSKDLLNGIELRDYQIHAANALIQKCRGIARMATNSGKTEVMAAVIKALDQPTIVLTHRKEIMYQTAERFTLRGLAGVGMIGDGVWTPAHITVAMIQTLSQYKPSTLQKRWKELNDNKVLFIDECHTLPSASATQVFMTLPGCYRYGVSGTPLNNHVLHDLKLVAATGEIVYEISNEYLIEQGYSAKPEILVAIIEEKSDVMWEMDYQDAYDKLIVHNNLRNTIIFDFVLGTGGVVLILVNRIEHGELLAKMFTGSTFINGSDSTAVRQAALEAMRNGRGVYIATPILDEGVDIPSVNTIIMAGGGASQTKLLQRVGRGLRKKQGNNNRLVVLDFIDDTNDHLLEHSNSRINTYATEGFELHLYGTFTRT